MGKRARFGPVVDLAEVLRAYVEEKVGEGPAADFCAKTQIPSSDIANILNRKANRRVTFDKLEKIAKGYNSPWSRVFADLSIIAARMEGAEAKAAALSAPSPAGVPSPRTPR